MQNFNKSVVFNLQKILHYLKFILHLNPLKHHVRQNQAKICLVCT